MTTINDNTPEQCGVGASRKETQRQPQHKHHNQYRPPNILPIHSLSEILNYPTQVQPLAPCCACIPSSQQENDEEDGYDFLSYQDAKHAQRRHDQFLRHLCRLNNLRLHEEEDEKNHHPEGVVVVQQTEVVLAYLSLSNSVDFMLSVLAATEMTHSTSSSNWSNTKSTTTTVVPALLNARWTPHEMAAALQPSSVSDNHDHFTFLIHDGSPAMEQKAHQTKQKLLQMQQPLRSRRVLHKVTCVALPCYATFHKVVPNDKLDEQPSLLLDSTIALHHGRRCHHQTQEQPSAPSYTVPSLVSVSSPTESSTRGSGGSTDTCCSDLTISSSDNNNNNNITSSSSNYIDAYNHYSSSSFPPPPLYTENYLSQLIHNLSREEESTTTNTVALIVFTSGTSGGTAKGVLLSHRAILVQALAKLQSPCSYSNQTIVLATTVPLFHVGGLSSLLATWLAGGCWVLPVAARTTTTAMTPTRINSATTVFDPKQVVRSLSVSSPRLIPFAAAVNTLVVVPAMLFSLQQYIKSTTTTAVQETRSSSSDGCDSTCRFPNVRLVLVGGQSASTGLVEFCRQTFPQAKLVQTYACTEAASSLTFWQLPAQAAIQYDDAALKRIPPHLSGDCVGQPPDHVELYLFDMTSTTTTTALTRNDKNANQQKQETQHQEPKEQQQQPPGQDDQHQEQIKMKLPKLIQQPFVVGRIATRGPHVMNGYWQRGGRYSSGSSSRSTSAASFFMTTDLGFWDDSNQLWFCGRATDSVRTGGETVMAPEVERVVIQHEAILECAVFALPNDRLGEVVCCALVVDKNYVGDNHDNDQSSSSNNNHNNPIEQQQKRPSLLDIRKWCTSRGLAGYKQPKRVFYVNELPKNSSGKVLKFLLVERFRDDAAANNNKLPKNSRL